MNRSFCVVRRLTPPPSKTSALERIAHQDHVFPLRRGRDERARLADKFLKASHIDDRFGRQIGPTLLEPHAPQAEDRHRHAGATEAALCCLLIERSLPLPPQGETADPALAPIALVQEQGSVDIIMSNSFAFGGSNVAVCLGREQP